MQPGAGWRARRGCVAALSAIAILAGLDAHPGAAQQPVAPPAPRPADPPRLTVTLPDSPGVGSAVVRGTGLLTDAVFTGALRDGFPVRFHYRLELWRDSPLFDRLANEQEWFELAQLDPLSGVYSLTRSDGTEQQFATLEAVQRALASPYAVDLPLPQRQGRTRYYYVASLSIESLSLSELAEVERWLRGDLGRAITREGDVGSALERGARRLLIRFSGLPRRRLEARTPGFTYSR